jgi:hypothetical protein
MGFEILLYSSNLGTEKREIVNPFTGEKQLVTDDPGLTNKQREAILELIKSYDATDESGTYSISLEGGELLDIDCGELESDDRCTLLLIKAFGLTPRCSQLIFDIASAGEMIIHPIMAEERWIAISDSDREKTVRRWPNVSLLDSPTHLHDILAQGAEQAEAYRRQIGD